MSATQLDALVDELAIVAGRIERESSLRIEAAISDLRRVDAERELRLSNLERAVAERLGAVKDGKDGAAGSTVTLDDVAPLILAEVGKAVASLPAPKDGKDGLPGVNGKDGQGVTASDVAPLIVTEIAKALASIPVPKDGKDGAAGQHGKDGLPGKDGADGKAGVDGKIFSIDDVLPAIVSEIQTRVAEIPVPKDGRDGKDGEQGSAGKDGMPGAAGEKGLDGRNGLDGKDGLPGERGPAGLFPIVKAWTDRVHYEGHICAHRGGTYQASRDTAKEPPHEDWICLSAPGENGKDGRSPHIRETYSPDVKDYIALDIVALNGAAFIARRDNPGPCPGAGWQMISMQGKPGKPGERGVAGPRGATGPAIVSMSIDAQGLLNVVNADGTEVECDLYPVLAKVR